MKRLALALLPVAALLVLAGPMWRGAGAAGKGLCADMTPARMLENPELAHEWAEALRSSRPTEIERIKALLEHIRAVHGCDGQLAMPEGPSGLPPGHPPMPDADPRLLPPGHPPIPSAPGLLHRFGEPDIVTI